MANSISAETLASVTRIGAGECYVNLETVPQFMADLAQYAQADPTQGEQMQEMALDRIAGGYGYYGPRETDKPFIYRDGVAIIPVHGLLLNRFNSCWGFATGYNFIRAQLNAVLEDIAEEGGDVQLLAFDHNSPGGVADGCFELCAEIMAARERIQMISVVDSLSASGSYALASAPQRMVCTPSGSVGSIGVYRIHVDMSGYFEQAGIKHTIFQGGEHKTDLNPFGPPSEKAAQIAQRGVEKRWDEFIAVVAEQRDMDPERVRDTQAQIFRADEALDLGLIDAVNTPREAVSEFLAELANDEPSDEDGDEEMALPKNQAELDNMISAATDAGKASVQVPDVNAAVTAAVSADRKRRQDIMGLPEANNRQKLATTLADGDYTVDQAKALLTAAAEEKVEPAAPAKVEGETGKEQTAAPGESQSAFLARMEKEGHPQVQAGGLGNGTGGTNAEPSDADKANAILTAGAQFGGHQYRSFDPAKK